MEINNFSVISVIYISILCEITDKEPHSIPIYYNLLLCRYLQCACTCLFKSKNKYFFFF